MERTKSENKYISHKKKVSYLYNTKILETSKLKFKEKKFKKTPKRLLSLKKKKKNYIKFLQFYYKYKKNYFNLTVFNKKNKFKINKNSFKTQENKLNVLYNIIKKPTPSKLGIIRVYYKKRNIFLVLSDVFGKTYSYTSSGTLVKKKKKFIPSYLVKDTAKKIIGKLFILKLKQFRKLVLMFKGRQHRKTKNALLEPFKKHKKLKVLSVVKMSSRSHNGCRPSKIRRK